MGCLRNQRCFPPLAYARGSVLRGLRSRDREGAADHAPYFDCSCGCGSISGQNVLSPVYGTLARPVARFVCGPGGSIPFTVFGAGLTQPVLELLVKLCKIGEPHVVHEDISDALDPVNTAGFQRARQHEVNVNRLFRDAVYACEPDVDHECDASSCRGCLVRAAGCDELSKAIEQRLAAGPSPGEKFVDGMIAARVAEVSLDESGPAARTLPKRHGLVPLRQKRCWDRRRCRDDAFIQDWICRSRFPASAFPGFRRSASRTWTSALRAIPTLW